MNAKQIYDVATERTVARRAANFLTPYLRDLLGDFEPRLAGIEAQFNYLDRESRPVKLTHVRVIAELQCVPADPIAKILQSMVDGETLRILDTDGDIVASCTLKSFAMSTDNLTVYFVNLDFFGAGALAVARGFQRIYHKPEAE